MILRKPPHDFEIHWTMGALVLFQKKQPGLGIFVSALKAVIGVAECSLIVVQSWAQAVGLAARKYVVRHFNRTDQAAAFLSLLTHLCNQKRRWEPCFPPGKGNKSSQS